jgi:hypothetical protein
MAPSFWGMTTTPQSLGLAAARYAIQERGGERASGDRVILNRAR